MSRRGLAASSQPVSATSFKTGYQDLLTPAARETEERLGPFDYAKYNDDWEETSDSELIGKPMQEVDNGIGFY